MICKKRKLLYLHPPRNGGKSIEDVIFNTKPKIGSSCHKKITDFIKIRSLTDVNSYYKFMFCRNPWDRAVSLYHACKQIYGLELPDFTEWIYGSYSQSKKKSSYANWQKTQQHPQINWITHKNKIIKLNFLGRFENYEEDFNKLCEKLDMNIATQTKEHALLKLPHHNKSKHKPYWRYYNNKTQKIIANVFKKDVEYFKYEFGEKNHERRIQKNN